MQRQGSFADLEASGQRRRTRRERFPGQTGAIVPRGEWVAPVESHYPDGRRGRRPVGCERMPGTCLLQVWFHLSDEACEDAVLDSRAMRRFVSIDMMSEQVPDSTTLPVFRHLSGGEGLGEGMHAARGPVVDATLAGSPSPARKGNNRYLGHEAHAGVDAGTGLMRTVEVTAANVSDVAVVPSLLRPDDGFCYAGGGHAGAQGRQQTSAIRTPRRSSGGSRGAVRRFRGATTRRSRGSEGQGAPSPVCARRPGTPSTPSRTSSGPGGQGTEGPGRAITSSALPSRSRASPCSHRREGP